nr:hypothetical protein [uncultured Flavobacterium sp.]
MKRLFKRAVNVYCVFLTIALVMLVFMLFETSTTVKGTSFLAGACMLVVANITSLLTFYFAKDKRTKIARISGFTALVLTAVVAVSAIVRLVQEGPTPEVIPQCTIPAFIGTFIVLVLFGTLEDGIFGKKETTA